MRFVELIVAIGLGISAITAIAVLSLPVLLIAGATLLVDKTYGLIRRIKGSYRQDMRE